MLQTAQIRYFIKKTQTQFITYLSPVDLKQNLKQQNFKSNLQTQKLKKKYKQKMDEVDIQSLLPPKQQNPLLKRKPLNLGNSFLDFSVPGTTQQIQNPLTAHQATLLYFGAAWCNISKPFTKQLKACYDEINLEYKKLEIIYVSVDKNQEEFEQGVKGMPWIGIPCSDARVADLKEFYNVRSIPTLLLIDKKGEEVSRECRNDVYSMGEDAAFEKWRKLKDEQESKY